MKIPQRDVASRDAQESATRGEVKHEERGQGRPRSPRERSGVAQDVEANTQVLTVEGEFSKFRTRQLKDSYKSRLHAYGVGCEVPPIGTKLTALPPADQERVTQAAKEVRRVLRRVWSGKRLTKATKVGKIPQLGFA